MSQENVEVVRRVIAALGVERIEAVDETRVLVFAELRFRSQGGVPLTQPIANLYDLTRGKLQRVQVFLERPEALEAAGLSE